MRRALLVLMVAAAAAGCGPGRGAGRRNGYRRSTPLVFSQHVPNVGENSLAGSGLPEGRVTRDNEKFKDLVPNYNPDIIFKDDEGTGADRFMTQRCKEKLDTLAISVMNMWPNFNLKVITGWVEGERHVRDSLHYEGRAVDIAISDRDRTKYGMLARLAVEAGFDWVYYESRSYVHCSVKSESSSTNRGSGCFPGGARVHTPAGERDIASLRPGDRVLAAGENGTLEYSEVLTFLDRQPTQWREFIELSAVGGVRLTATPGHLVLLARNSSTPAAVLARDVRVGDRLLVVHGQSTRAAAVLATRLVRRAGLFAPLTRAGTIVVDGALASCYALVRSHALAHAAVAPLRWFAAARGLSQVQTEGVHWYIGWLYTMGEYVLPASYW